MTIEESKLTPTTTTKLNHVRTYIHTYMEKRRKDNDSVDIHFIFYDRKELDTLKQTCFVNNTNISSVISNIVREFNLSIQSDTPQTTLFNYAEEAKIPFLMDADEISNHLKSLTDDELQEAEWMSQTWSARIEKERTRR